MGAAPTPAPSSEVVAPTNRAVGWLAVGVVLSGTGSDGTLGIIEIKAAGGVTFAQDASAQHGGMPDSAIHSGAVDLVLEPAAIGAVTVFGLGSTLGR